MAEENTEQTENRHPSEDKPWLFKPGESGNPGGRPKDTLKAFMAREFRAMSDDEKRKWLKDNKVSAETIWKMSEGNPSNDVDVKTDSTIRIISIDE